MSALPVRHVSECKVEMTAPVSCLIEPGAGPACESTFTVSFYIPEEHQADPPKPTDPDVFIENRQEVTLFVRCVCVKGYTVNENATLAFKILRSGCDRKTFRILKIFIF